MIRDVRIIDGQIITLSSRTALAPFTLDDVAYCEEQLARWNEAIAESPATWPTGGNEGIWTALLALLAAHGRGEPAAFAGLLSGVAIDGHPCGDARCRALLRHMLAATPDVTGAAA